MIGKILHEELLVSRWVVQLSLLPALVPGHKIGEAALCVVQLVVEVRELSHLIGVAAEVR